MERRGGGRKLFIVLVAFLAGQQGFGHLVDEGVNPAATKTGAKVSVFRV